MVAESDSDEVSQRSIIKSGGFCAENRQNNKQPTDRLLAALLRRQSFSHGGKEPEAQDDAVQENVVPSGMGGEKRVRAHGKRVTITDLLAEGVVKEGDQWKQELALIAFGDIGDFFGPDGNLLDVNELSLDAKRRLGSVKVLREKVTRSSNGGVERTTTIDQTTEVKPWDKLRALDMLGKNLGMFRDRVNIGADVSLLDALRRIEAREDEEAIRGAK